MAISAAGLAYAITNQWPVAAQLGRLLRGVSDFPGFCDDGINCAEYFSVHHWIILTAAGVLLGKWLASRGMQAHSAAMLNVPGWVLVLAAILGAAMWALVVYIAFTGEQFWHPNSLWSYLTQYLVAYEPNHLVFVYAAAIIAVSIVLLFSALKISPTAVTSPVRALGRFALSALCLIALMNYVVPEVVLVDDAGNRQLQARSANRTPPSIVAREQFAEVEYKILDALSDMATTGELSGISTQDDLTEDDEMIQQWALPLSANTEHAVVEALHSRLEEAQQQDTITQLYMPSTQATAALVRAWEIGTPADWMRGWGMLLAVPGVAELNEQFAADTKQAQSITEIATLLRQYQWQSLETATEYLREQGVISSVEQQLYLERMRQDLEVGSIRFGWDWHDDAYGGRPPLSDEDYGDVTTAAGRWRSEMPDTLALPYPDTTPWSTKNIVLQYPVLLLLAWLWSRRFERGPVEWLLHRAHHMMISSRKTG